MAACKCSRPKITISCNFRNLHKHILDPTDEHKIQFSVATLTDVLHILEIAYTRVETCEIQD